MSEHDNMGGVTIGAREIYDAVVSLREDVRSLTQTHESVDQKLDDHESRIRGVERWKYGLPASLLVSTGALVTSFLKSAGKV